MKKVLILAAIIFCMQNTKAQIYLDDTTFSIGSIHIDLPNKLDTIPVIMLVCDTAKQNLKMLDSEGRPFNFNDRNISVEWQFGYSVNIKKTTRGMPPFMEYWEHLYYLDENKNPLSKSIIVWQSLEIKK